MEALGDQLLAGAALADHQHRPVERRGAARPLDRVEEGGGLADQLGVAFHHQRLGRIPMLWQEKDATESGFKLKSRGFPPLFAIGTPLVEKGT